METHTRYKILLIGINPGDDPEKARAGLARVFRFDSGKIDKLLSSLPVTLKSDLDYKTAISYRAILAKAGGSCRLEPMKPKTTISPAVKECPRCGYKAKSSNDPLITAHDGRGECPDCGVIIAKLTKETEDNQEAIAPVQDVSSGAVTFWGEMSEFFFSRPLLLLGVGVLVIGLVVWSVFPGGDSGAEKIMPAGSIVARNQAATKQAGNRAQKAIEDVENISANNTKTSGAIAGSSLRCSQASRDTHLPEVFPCQHLFPALH